MTTKRERDEFVAAMVQEYPAMATGLLLTILDKLMRLSKKHCRLQEQACNEQVPEDHDAKCEQKIRELCNQLYGCSPVFSGDPRGCTVKLRVPSGKTNDWGQTGICVPQ